MAGKRTYGCILVAIVFMLTIASPAVSPREETGVAKQSHIDSHIKITKAYLPFLRLSLSHLKEGRNRDLVTYLIERLEEKGEVDAKDIEEFAETLAGEDYQHSLVEIGLFAISAKWLNGKVDLVPGEAIWVITKFYFGPIICLQWKAEDEDARCEITKLLGKIVTIEGPHRGLAFFGFGTCGKLPQPDGKAKTVIMSYFTFVIIDSEKEPKEESVNK